MKLLGDVPEQDKILAGKLVAAELEIDTESAIPNDIKAKCYICFAHDWYEMGADEEGHRLLLKAEKVFPGYSKNLMRQHMNQDEDFAYLVKRIATQVLFILEQVKDEGSF